MTVSPTEDPKYLTSNLPDRIVEDEVIFMDGGTAPFWPHWQRLYDRTALLLLGAAWELVWNGDFSVDPGGSASSFTLRVGAIQGLVLVKADGSSYDGYYYAGGTVGASKIEGGGSLSANTWYYVYAIPGSVSGGVCDFEISTTGPNAARTHKSGSGTAYNSRRYLACFRTDSTGAPFPMRTVKGRSLYRRGGMATPNANFAGDGLRALEDVGTHVAASLDLSSRIPPHARVVILNGQINATSSGSSGAAELNLYTADDTTSVAHAIAATVSAASGDTSQNSSLAELETTSAQAIRYSVTNTAVLLDAYSLDVMGWCE